MSNLPNGTVTFLFTDIEGSTKLWDDHPEEMKAALAKHDSILKAIIDADHGYVIKSTGDGVHAVFEKAIDAVNATIKIQHDLQADSASSFSLKVRMGLHTGEAELRDGDYFGSTLNRAARIMSAGHGGQILISEVTMQLAREHFPSTVSVLDMGEHHLKGLVHAEKIYQLVAPDLQQDFPALMSIATATNNLPTQLTSFIGRERELREAKQKLSDARLLTLIGPGGTGKSRLSLQLAEEVLPDFADGVWFVELAPLVDPELILQTIASVLNVRAQIGMPLKDIVSDYLRAKNMLIILDNCEHLIEACAQLVDQCLHNAPKTKIIVSSREALGIGGETVFRVPSLTLPNAGQTSREALAGFESIQLFVARAKAANPKFELTEKNAASVAQICRRLDGIPLALELAAARASVFSAEQIASRLDDRFKLLTGGSRTALPRQQTLRALIDWSYDLLSDVERALLRRLSVFAGGWTFEAAEFVCPNHDVMDLLTQLVNKSLVIVDDDDSESTRYRLLETIRQYARDKLLDAGESFEARKIHSRFFLQMAENAERELFKANSVKLVNSLENEQDNIRVALEWTTEEDVESALRIVYALQLFWNRRGYTTEGRNLGEAVIASAEALPPLEGEAAVQRKTLIAKAFSTLIALAISQGDNQYVSEISAKFVFYASGTINNGLLARGLAYMCAGRLAVGDIEGVDNWTREALEHARASTDAYALGLSLGVTSQFLMITGGDIELARDYASQSKKVLREHGNQWGYTLILLGIGMVAKYKGDYKLSRENFGHILPLFHEMGDIHRVNMIQSEFAHMDRFEGYIDKAEQAYCKTILEWQRLGHRAAVANQLECLAFVALSHEQEDRAVKLLGAAESLRERINIQMSPFERIEYEKHVSELKNGLDEKAFSNLWSEGRSMTMEQAVAFAVESQPGSTKA
jgi:predicted ATPase/class 3 adenylate cyclase